MAKTLQNYSQKVSKDILPDNIRPHRYRASYLPPPRPKPEVKNKWRGTRMRVSFKYYNQRLMRATKQKPDKYKWLENYEKCMWMYSSVEN